MQSGAENAMLRALRRGQTIRLGNERAELDRLMRWIVEIFEGSGVQEPVLSAAQICIDEVFANILEHGRGEGRANAVVVTMRVDESTLVVSIDDNGAAFDPRAVAEPEQAESLDEARIGGLGIHFIRTLSSSMAYQRREGWNELVLTFANAVTDKPLPSPAGRA